MQWNRPIGPLAYLLVMIIPLLTVWGFYQGGLYNFSVLVFVFGIVPLLDFVLGTYRYNPSPEECEELLERKSFQWVTWFLFPAPILLTLWGAWVITHVELTTLELVGLTLSVGMASGGIGINLSHELMHKTTKHERLMAQLLLLNTYYMHFIIEHILGHHRHIGTHQDPATARQGETLYTFYFRSVFGGVKSAWEIESKRLKKKSLAFWSHHNNMLWYTIWPNVYGVVLALIFGWQALPFFIIQGIIGFSLLEGVNYVEHYGLVRQKMDNGYFEPVSICHSWNANQMLTNIFLFMLQRHSDHHAHQSRRFQILRHFDESPQLPTGYAGMLVLATCPPLWRWVMDPKVDAYHSRNTNPGNPELVPST